MKLTIPAIPQALRLPSGALTFPHHQDGAIHTIELAPDAQHQLAKAILACDPAEDGTTARWILQPTAAKVMKSNTGRTMLVFYMGAQALHVALSAEESEALRGQLAAATQMNTRTQ